MAHRLPPLLLVAYAVLLVASRLLHPSGSGDSGGMTGVLVQALGSLLLAYALWKRARWAWWVGAVFCGTLSLLGVVGLWITLTVNSPAGLSHLALGIAIFATATLLLLASFVILILRRQDYSSTR